jgi:hypothetical protein
MGLKPLHEGDETRRVFQRRQLNTRSRGRGFLFTKNNATPVGVLSAGRDK